jgi:hypothetical protein
VLATAHAGRIASKSRSLFKMIIFFSVLILILLLISVRRDPRQFKVKIKIKSRS